MYPLLLSVAPRYENFNVRRVFIAEEWLIETVVTGTRKHYWLRVLTALNVMPRIRETRTNVFGLEFIKDKTIITMVATY